MGANDHLHPYMPTHIIIMPHVCIYRGGGGGGNQPIVWPAGPSYLFDSYNVIVTRTLLLH